MRKNSRGNLLDGLVVDNDDPQQMGRLKIWVPSLDGDSYEIENLPWAHYLSPLAGQTLDFVAGEHGVKSEGYASYGFWAIPKIGAVVIVGLVHNDPNLRVYMGSLYGEHGNRSLPAGRNRPDITPGPLTDTLDPLRPAMDNLKLQFQGQLSASEALTRGAYERAAAQDKTIKDGTEGYQKSTINSDKLESQTYCLVTPGHHAIIFQDNPTTSRMRMKTAGGHQIIMDDANERIYISTAQGNNYIELDADGRIFVYANNDVAMYVGGNLDYQVVGNFNVAAENINFSARKDMKISSCENFHISAGGNLNLSTDKQLNLKSGENTVLSSSRFVVNSSQTAEAAKCADSPSIVPQHEPWTRPGSKIKRNKNWKP